MTYTLIANQGNLSIFNRVTTASEAHRLVLQRRQDGSGTIAIYDESGKPISASDLASIAEPNASSPDGAPSPHPLMAAPGVTIKLGGKIEPRPPEPEESSKSRSRVRVFKAPGRRDD